MFQKLQMVGTNEHCSECVNQTVANVLKIMLNVDTWFVVWEQSCAVLCSQQSH